MQLIAADTFLVQRLFWLGRDGYEPIEAARWQAACEDAKHVVELGANIGWYAVLGARANPAARYVAVEPQPFAVSLLRQNLELNGLTNVEVVEAAVVGTDGPATIQLHFPDATLHNPAPGRAFVTGAEFQLLEAHTSLDVPTVGAAPTCAGADVIKLDIEGLEADVLAAAEAEITVARPRIFVEIQPEATKLAQLIARWERDHGYRVNPLGRYDLILEPK
jgi:FkbM family methyltransferase